MTTQTIDTSTYEIAFPIPTSRDAWIDLDASASPAKLTNHALILNHDAQTIERWEEYSISGTREDVYFGRSDIIWLGNQPDAIAVYNRVHEISCADLSNPDALWRLQEELSLGLNLCDIADYYAGSGMTAVEIYEDASLSLDEFLANGLSRSAFLGAAQRIDAGAPNNDCYLLNGIDHIADWLIEAGNRAVDAPAHRY